jgi:hypothetical protein
MTVKECAKLTRRSGTWIYRKAARSVVDYGGVFFVVGSGYFLARRDRAGRYVIQQIDATAAHELKQRAARASRTYSVDEVRDFLFVVAGKMCDDCAAKLREVAKNV